MLRVLNGHSLDTKALLYPENMGLNLSERDSTATPTVDRDAPQLQVGDWVQDMEEPGAGIVWRVRTADTQYNTETISYTLEHLINSLADRILPDEVKAGDMGGSGDSCTAKQAFQYILGKQSDWTLGDFEYEGVSNPYHFSGETLKAALETVTNSLEDPVWEYDFSTYPFRLHVRQLSETVDSELREGRNLTSLKYTIDRTRMYTRFYPVGKNNLKPAGKYVSKNEATYGRVDKTETDQSKDTEAKLIAWANERLARHAEPLVTVTISGLDLSEGTGESLDKMTICHKCRVPLPAYGTTIIEKVTKLSWRDKIKDKESVTVTLANALADVQSIIREAISKGGGGRRTAAELNYGIETTIGNVESGLYTRITQTAYEIRQEAHDESRSLRSIITQTAESIRLEVINEAESLRSSITQTAESIRLEVENTAESLRSSITQTAESIRLEVANEAESLRSSITQTAESIRLEVENTAESLRSSITQTAESIRAEVADESASIRSVITQTASSIRSEITDTASSLRSSITQTASSIRAEVSGVADSTGHVTAASIALAINNAGEGVATIDADKIYLLGQTIADQITADYISTKIASLSSLSVASIACSGTIGANELQVGTLKFRSSSGAGYSFSDLKDLFVTSVEVSGPVNNVYTLKYFTANNAQGTSGGTFSRATSLDGVWSGGGYTVTASPQGNTIGTIIGKKGESWDGNTCTVTVGYENPVSGAMVSTGCVFDIDASGRDASSGAAISRHGSGYSWDFTITRGDGSTKTLTIDCSDIYTAARDGYTLGTFTQQTITLQGSQTSAITTQGTAASTTTVTLQGSQTSDLTLQGAQHVVTPIGSSHIRVAALKTVYKQSSSTYTKQGTKGPKLFHYGEATLKTSGGTELTQDWYYVSNSSRAEQYYNAGTSSIHEAVEDGQAYPKVSSSYTGNTVYYTAGTDLTLYDAGTNVGKLYNAGTTATYYPATETLYKAGTNIGRLYNAGTVSTDYYTKS